MNISFFNNGNTMAFNSENEQVPIAQKSWLVLFAEYLAINGIDPCEQSFLLSDGRTAKIIRNSDGQYTFSLKYSINGIVAY